MGQKLYEQIKDGAEDQLPVVALDCKKARVTRKRPIVQKGTLLSSPNRKSWISSPDDKDGSQL